MRIRPLFFLMLAIMLVACSGSSGSSSKDTPGSGITLPGTTFPHKIEFYDPGVATRAIVFLHGALGTNYGMAYSLGINTLDAPPTSNSTNWTWLEDNHVLAVFPQGQAIYSVLGKPVTTWSNHVMDSGQDDMAFLQALVGYISSQYGITDVTLAGHSNGGMMANRVWCEDPTLFKAYFSMSGPASDYYFVPPPASPPTPAISANGSQAACNPLTVQPYFGIVGDQDTVLSILTYGFTNPTYAIDDRVTDSPAVLDPILIGEWYQQANVRVPMMCAETPDLGIPAEFDGVTNTWSNCGGKMILKEVTTAGHSIDSLETNSGYTMIDLLVAFIDGL